MPDEQPPTIITVTLSDEPPNGSVVLTGGLDGDAPPAGAEVFVAPPDTSPIDTSQWNSIGTIRPEDLPAPEPRVVLGFDGARGQAITVSVVDEVHVWVNPDITRFTEAMNHVNLRLTQWQESVLLDLYYGNARPFDRAHLNQEVPARPAVEPAEPTPMQRALELRRNRNTGPATRQRAPRRIDARRTR